MTTVAYRAGVMASDTISTWGDEVYPKCLKVANIANTYLMGLSGMVSSFVPYAEWLNALVGESVHPMQFYKYADKLSLSQDRQSTVLIVDRNGQIYHIQDGYSVMCGRDFDSIGSGAEFATGAMESGATARKAVKVGCKFDSGSGLPVASVTFKSPPTNVLLGLTPEGISANKIKVAG